MHATLSMEDIQLLNLLESRTGSRGKDVVRLGNTVVFVVDGAELGKALGKRGQNVARLRRDFGKHVEFVEVSDSLEGFVHNLFKPAHISQVVMSQRGGQKVVMLHVDPQNRGLAVGRNGEKIKRARALLKRYYDIEEIKLM